jgi:hypothetical protein
MFAWRVKCGVLVGLFASAVAWLPTVPATGEEPNPAEPLDAEAIERRLNEIQPTATERRFDAIGWVSGVRAAERLAREHGRPVFLFSNVGQMDIGRC